MTPAKCTQLRFILRESVFTAIQIGKFLPEREIEFSTSGKVMVTAVVGMVGIMKTAMMILWSVLITVNCSLA